MKANGFATIPEELASKLQDLIFVEKKYRAGDRIPAEQELADMFGVSRNSVREAVKILVNSGVLKIERGRGTFVRRQNQSSVDLLGLMKTEDESTLMKDWMQVRIVLEPLAVTNAVANATDEEISNIVRWAEVCEKNFLQGESIAEADKCFHISLARASGNCIIERLLPSMETAISDILNVNLYTLAYKDDRAFVKSVVMEHKLIAEQIALRNSEAAINLLKGHLQKVSFCLDEGLRMLKK